MSHLTDDEIRAIWSILPLDQEPTVENLVAYVNQVLQHIYDNYNSKISAEKWPLEREAFNLSIQLIHLNDQYRNLMAKYRDLSTQSAKILGRADIYYKLHFPEELEKVINK